MLEYWDLLTSHTPSPGLLSICVALVAPLVLGPLLALATLLCRALGGRTPASHEDFASNCLCLALMTAVFVVTYSINMIVSEAVFESVDMMSYILLKFCVGSLHTSLTPLAVLASYPEVRRAVVRVFVRGGTQQNNSIEVSEDDVKKELGHLGC